MKRSRSVCGLFVLALLATGCGNDSESAAPKATARPSASAVPADASKSPVTVGFHNLEGGTISLPDVRKGFEAGVNYVNAELGGVNGHPLKAINCNVEATPESSVKCANQFAEKDVVLAVQGVDFAVDAALPILKSAGIVELTPFPIGPASDKAVGDVYATQFSASEGYAASVLQQQLLGAKKLAYVLVDQPASHASMNDVVKPAAVKVGVTVAPFFYPAQVDWTTQAATVLASKPDAVTLFATEPDCLSAVPALRSAGFKGVIHAGTCTAIIAKLDGEVLKDVLISTPFYTKEFTEIPAKPKAELAIFETYMRPNGTNYDVQQAMQGFHIAVQAADMLRQIPGSPLTAKAVHDGMGTTKGSEFFRTIGYDCSKPSWPASTACGTGFIFAKVTASKKLEVLPNQPADVSGIRP